MHTQATTRLTTYTLLYIHILDKLTATVSPSFMSACIEPRGWLWMNGFPQLLPFVSKGKDILQLTAMPSLSNVVTCITIDRFNIHTPSKQYRDSHYIGEMLMRQSYLFTGNSYNVRAHFHADSARYLAISKEMWRAVGYMIQTLFW